jgi:hypothetical protein
VDNSAARRTPIKDEIAQTTEQLINATMEDEVQKLQGVPMSLTSNPATCDGHTGTFASTLVRLAVLIATFTGIPPPQYFEIPC